MEKPTGSFWGKIVYTFMVDVPHINVYRRVYIWLVWLLWEVR